MLQSLHNNLKFVVIIFAIPILVSCTTTQKNFSEVKLGQWETRALVKDTKTNKSFIIYMTFIAENKGRLRLDVTSSVGSQISSMVVDNGQVNMLLLRDKKFYKGPPNSAKLYSVTNLPIDARLLSNIVFDTPIEQKGWSCSKDQKGLITDCKNLGDNVKFTVTERAGVKRTVTVTHPRGSAQVSFTNFKDSGIEPEKAFTLPTPKSFVAL